jgi:hypothetical protein
MLTGTAVQAANCENLAVQLIHTQILYLLVI